MCRLDLLPVELLELILSFLHPEEARGMRLVCRGWSQIRIKYPINYIFVAGVRWNQSIKKFQDECRLVDPTKKLHWTIAQRERCMTAWKFREHAAVTSQHNSIFVAGGLTPSNRTASTAYLFNMSLRKWKKVASLPSPRMRSSAVFLTPDQIVITGGRTRKLRPTTDNLIYTVSLNKWDDFPSNGIYRSDHASVMYQNNILLLGGYEHMTYGLKTGSLYNCNTRTWHGFPWMTYGRYNFSVAVVNEKIFAFGGPAKASSSSVEMYDGSCWSVLPITLPRPRRFRCFPRYASGKIFIFADIIRDDLKDGLLDVLDPETLEWSTMSWEENIDPRAVICVNPN